MATNRNCTKKIMLNSALKYIRIYHHLSQKELAERLGISRSYLCEIESNKKSASIYLLEKYSEIFGIPASSILFFSEKLGANTLSKKQRVYIAGKILKIIKWLITKEKDHER